MIAHEPGGAAELPLSGFTTLRTGGPETGTEAMPGHLRQAFEFDHAGRRFHAHQQFTHPHHEAGELHLALEGDHADVEALDVGVGQQRGLDAAGHARVIDLGAHGAGGSLEGDAVFDLGHTGHAARDRERLVDLCLAVDKAAELHGALAGLDLQVKALDRFVAQQGGLDARGDDGIVHLGAHRDARRGFLHHLGRLVAGCHCDLWLQGSAGWQSS